MDKITIIRNYCHDISRICGSMYEQDKKYLAEREAMIQRLMLLENNLKGLADNIMEDSNDKR